MATYIILPPKYRICAIIFSDYYHIYKKNRANDGVRTRDNWLGKPVLYQLSYIRLQERIHSLFFTLLKLNLFYKKVKQNFKIYYIFNIRYKNDAE